jgi:uncharacterized membrane protein YvbJ
LIYCRKCGKELADESRYCTACGTPVVGKRVEEEFEASGEDLVEKVRALIHEGNVRRIIIRGQDGKTVMEIPVTVGVIGAILVPVLAAIGALAALAMKYTIVVERREG